MSPEEMMNHVTEKHGDVDNGLFHEVLKAVLSLQFQNLIAKGVSQSAMNHPFHIFPNISISL
jgi:hypothetical protein